MGGGCKFATYHAGIRVSSHSSGKLTAAAKRRQRSHGQWKERERNAVMPNKQCASIHGNILLVIPIYMYTIAEIAFQEV